MKRFGLIGYPLSHSFSQKFFNQKFIEQKINAHYQSFPLKDISELPSLISSNENLLGLNVTIPYKTSVIKYLNFISKEADKIGAVNCIHIIDRKLYGHNTDFIGFRESLLPLLKSEIKKALILGTGGASKAVAYALTELGIAHTFVSRAGNGALSYEHLNAKIVAEHLLVINTTPLGMSPEILIMPEIPYEGLSKQHLLFDLVYNPEISLFLQQGIDKQASIKNGLEMLHIQAEKSWEIWNGLVGVETFIPLR